MMEKLKSIKIDVTISALLTVAIGVLLLFWPGEVVTVLTQIIAVILIVSGLVLFVPQLFSPVRSYASMAVSGLIALLGAWMFFSPSAVSSLIPIAIGVLLVVHGIQDLALAIEGKNKKATRWGVMILFALLNIALGALCIANAFGIVKVALQIIGAMLIYDGLSDMFIVRRVNQATRIIDSEITREEDVDDYEDYV